MVWDHKVNFSPNQVLSVAPIVVAVVADSIVVVVEVFYSSLVPSSVVAVLYLPTQVA